MSSKVPSFEKYAAVMRDAKRTTWSEIPDTLVPSRDCSLRGDRITILNCTTGVRPGFPEIERKAYVQYVKLSDDLGAEEFAYRVVFERTSLPQESWRVGYEADVLEVANVLKRELEDQAFYWYQVTRGQKLDEDVHDDEKEDSGTSGEETPKA